MECGRRVNAEEDEWEREMKEEEREDGCREFSNESQVHSSRITRQRSSCDEWLNLNRFN